MAKSNKKKRGVALTQSNYLRTGALALVGLVVAGGAFAATSGDLVYGGKSLLAQVSGYIDTTPRITIARDTYTPSASVWPGTEQNLAQFSVKPRYLGAYGYLRSFKASVHIDSKTAALYAGRIGARFVTCGYSGDGITSCKDTLLAASSAVASTTSKGLMYSFKGEMTPQVGSGVTGTLVVFGTPYYGSIYAASSSPAANIKAQIDAADGAGLICAPVNGTQSCAWKSVPVETGLAYGNWLKVNRGSGYAYGYWDINNSASLTASDADRVLKVAVGTLACPFTKKCDIDQSGRVTATDANLLLKYAVGSLPPPGVATSTPAVSVSSKIVSTKASQLADGQGKFTVTYQVTAMRGPVYIPTQASSSAMYNLYDSENVVRTFATVAALSSSVGISPNKNYVIQDGQTATFELVVLARPSSTGYYRLGMTGVRWGVGDDSAPEKTQAVDYKTSLVNLDPSYTEF